MTDVRAYEQWIKRHPKGSLWQSLERQSYSKACGLETMIEVLQEGETIVASALIVNDRSKAGEVWEIPRGPLWSDEKAAQQLVEMIVAKARAAGVIVVYVSPSTPLPLGGTWQPSGRSIQPTATRVIDLTQSEEEILSQMHQKGRYNIRVAEKAGVSVRQGGENDISTFYQLLKGTGNRDGFTVHPESHYRRFLTSQSSSFLLMAEHEKKPIAGLLGVIWNGTGIYYYGASDHAARALMAPYLLQWQAMRHCKVAGCTSYDLLGISPPDAKANDSWAGISDFKRKFGGTIQTYPKEHMLVLKPVRKLLVGLKRRILG
ncbi:MAG: peptidoglycan bridge formation glycyltransferase FemA/FemB family protein [Candidatus Peribacteraceae bacterium]